jgi:hypothetical protein
MRRSLTIATFVALLVLPAFGQRGMGARSIGGHAGFSQGMGLRSGFGGHPSGFAGHNGFVGSGRFGGFRTFPRHFHSAGFHDRFFFSFGLGYPFAYPYYYGGYSYPAYYSYAPAYAYPPAYFYTPGYSDDADSDERRRVEYEIERLNQKMDRLLAEREGTPTDITRGKQSTKDVPEKQKTVMLVFRDKHVQEVENYAIVGTTLWWFSEQRAKKIPLSELDLVATAKLNDERGISFPLPPAQTNKKK